jgi:hypothetical protein
MIHSEMQDAGEVRFPAFSGLRVMMLPVALDDPRTFPEAYRGLVSELVERSPVRRGVGYLTVDEALVRGGESHRRPGIHVDSTGAWSGGPAYAGNGMLVVASDVGGVAWPGDHAGDVGPDGDCDHLRAALPPSVPMRAGRVYRCSATMLHEGVPLQRDALRQFVRLSLPTTAPWYEGYTSSPCGVLPTGPVLPRRAAQMGYRP